MIVSTRFAATFVMTALVLGAGCSNECKDAAKKYTDIAASCGDTTVTYEFTAECDTIAIDCIDACDFLSETECDTDATTACINACISGPSEGGGGGG